VLVSVTVSIGVMLACFNVYPSFVPSAASIRMLSPQLKHCSMKSISIAEAHANHHLINEFAAINFKGDDSLIYLALITLQNPENVCLLVSTASTNSHPTS